MRLVDAAATRDAKDMGDPKEERRQFWIKVSLVILFLFSAADIFLMLFIVPKFEQIFADIAPGKPLPNVTTIIFSGRIVIAIITSCWPILGTIFFKRRKPFAILWINIGIVVMLLLGGITVIAVFLPMVSLGDIYGTPGP